MIGFESQLTSIHDKEKANLTGVKELGEALVVEKKRTNQLEGDLSITHADIDIDIKRCSHIRVEELSIVQKLQIEYVTVEHYKVYKVPG